MAFGSSDFKPKAVGATFSRSILLISSNFFALTVSLSPSIYLVSS
jgi:hypothetical protein